MVIAVRTERSGAGLEVVKHAGTEADRLRLQNEADWLKRAAHPGVVEVVAAAPTSLRLRHAGTALARMGPLAPDNAAAVVRSVASTVGDLHQLGVAHGRIDAEHVLIDARGRPRLCGFAEARAATDTTRADDVAALGQLLDTAVAPAASVMWSPPLRGLRAAARRKRALQGFRSAVSAARSEPPQRRPTARQLAAAIREALPELALPASGNADADDFVPFEGRSTDGTSADHQLAPAPLSPEPITIRPPTSEAAPTRPDRRLVTVMAAVVLIAGIVAGSAIARAVKPFGAQGEPRAASTIDAAGDSAPDASPSADAPATTVAPEPPPPPVGCNAQAAPGPDVDGDGCPDPVTLDGRIAQVGSVRVELGDDGDLVALGDPDCDGVVTPALLRPGTGEVFVFDEWNLSDPTEVEAAAVVIDGESISSAGPCLPFVITGRDGAETQVPRA